jgi:toxin ParE1/3/4
VKRRIVKYSLRSEEDAAWILDAVETAAGLKTALSYLTRLRDFCDRLEFGAERGTRHDHIRSGLRIVGFERRVTVAFVVDEDRVTVLRLFYGGQDWKREFEGSDPSSSPPPEESP